MANDSIAARIIEMKKAVGHTTDTFLLGYLIGALGIAPKDLRPLAHENPARYDNSAMPYEEAEHNHLEYLRDMFGLDDLNHAKAFSEYTESELNAMYRKMAESEVEMGGGERIPDSEMATKLMETIDHEGAKRRADRRTRIN